MRYLLRKIPPILIFTASVCGCAVAKGSDDAFSSGQKQLDEQQWQAAQTTFNNLVDSNSERQDAALYWLAYAQFKNNATQGALQTIARLHKRFPKSRWLDDAQALRVEIQDKTGDAPEIEDDELKLYAINALMNSSSDKAVGLLSKIIHGNNSPRLAKRALFVLSQIDKKEAFGLVVEVAEDSSNAQLQLDAIKVLGMMGSKPAIAALKNVYLNSDKQQTKDKILRSFMMAGERDELLALAKTEQNGKLRTTAIKMLGHISGSDALLTLYQDPSFAQHRDTIIKSIAIGGDIDALLQIVNLEQDLALKVKAVRRMGLISSSKSGDKLAKLYADNSEQLVREGVIHALFLQSNAQALIGIIKQEKDPGLKRKALKKLTLIDSNDAVDYFSEILGSKE